MRTTVFEPVTALRPASAPIDLDAVERRVTLVARLLDRAVTIPGTRIGIGLDSLAGFVPVAGDAVGMIASAYLIYEAQRLGAPEATLRKMAINVGVDAAVGIIPFAGDLFDVVFKANMKNLALLQDHIALLRSERARVVSPAHRGAIR